MSDFIFSSETIKKKNLYVRIKELLTEAGWENISSRPSTDFDVFYSDGEDGGLEMYINLREYSDSAARSISNSNYTEIGFKLPRQYTPSENIGTAGTYVRPDSWKSTRLSVSNNIPPESDIIIHYHCNLNRLTLLVEYPPAISHLSTGGYFIIGCSDRLLGKVRPRQECAVFITQHASNSIGSGYITDIPDNPANSAPLAYTYDALQIRSFTEQGKVLFSQVVYGGTYDGIRGVLDGIYTINDAIPAPATTNYHSLNKFKNGDEILDKDGKRYRVLEVYSYNNYSSLTTNKIAFRIE